MTERNTENFHWVGETLMAEEFGESVEICTVDWSGLDEFEHEHKCLMAAAHDLEKALNYLYHNAMMTHGDKMVAREALAKARGEQ